MAEDEGVLLKVEGLVTGYGKRLVLDGVSLTVRPGEIVALIGHNGAGKSTLLKAVFGLVPIWRGCIAIDGLFVNAPHPRDLLRSGVAYVPQGNRVFAELSVRENLEISGRMLGDVRLDERIRGAFTWFPGLSGRLGQPAGALSGGEKQMLALANALILSPRLLLLDEPSLGLAAGSTARTLERIRNISETKGTGVLVVEQKVREVLSVARQAVVLRNGRISFSGSAQELREDEAKLREVYI